MNGLLLGNDEIVARWTWATFKIVPVKYDMAVGIVNAQTGLVGAVLLHWWTGPNIYLGYYGPNTPTRGIARAICHLILDRFDVERLTVHVRKSNKRLTRWMVRMGAVYEGSCHHYLGKSDTAESTAIQYAVFRGNLERIAGWTRVREAELVNGKFS